ncbi:BTB domain-containing protein [Favolaschia claudopus]|uniref:BTB domain-containing protein n=1 Tax=Favolaschia claudopus TaxID=2862362 RepID=A0AAV9ZTM6_9AGAR
MSAQLELKRVEDLWFSDATLILRAQNSLFRVHSGILAARSSVFRDMIAFPTTYSGRRRTNRYRRYSTRVFFERPPAPVDFYAVVGVMRLSHKYDVPYLFRRALSHLDSMYPSELDAFMEVHNEEVDQHVEFEDSDPIVPLTALRAAAEVGATWLIPAAGYRFAFSREGLDSTMNQLQIHELKTYLTAHAEFVRASATIQQLLRNLPVPSCDSGGLCLISVSKAHDTLESWRRARQDCDPLMPFIFDLLGSRTGLCTFCSPFALGQFKYAQQQFWDNLPLLFGLPGWEDLKKMKKAFMDGAT